MRPAGAFLLAFASALAGCAAPGADGPVSAAGVAQEGRLPAYEALEFSGHIVQDEVGELSHTRETEQVLWPVQKVGFKAEVPEGVTAIEVALAWDGPGELGIDLHSHDHESGTCCVRHESVRDAQNPKCIRVPAEDVMAGVWEPMVRASGALRTDFTLTFVTVGGAATLLDERHGHDRVHEAQAGREDTFPEVEPCVAWSPTGHAH